MVFPAIKAGALSYLLKSASPDEVVDAVQAAVYALRQRVVPLDEE